MIASRHRAARGVGAGALAVVAMAMAAPAPAHAQLGGLVRKATHAVSSSRARTPKPGHPRFGATLLELNADRLAHVIDGLRAEQQMYTSASWRTHHDALARRRDSLTTALHTVEDQHDREQVAYEETSRQITLCRDSVSEAQRQRANAEVANVDRAAAATIDTAAIQAKGQALAKQMQEAAARGDMATVKKLQVELQRMVSAATQPARSMEARSITNSRQQAAADSIALDKACGRPPARPAFLAEQDSLSQAVELVRGRLRAVNDEPAEAAARVSGLSAAQLAMARERIHYFLSGSGEFTRAEIDALSAKRAEIEKLLATVEELEARA